MRTIIPIILLICLIGCTPDPVNKATDTITLHYLNHNIYPPAVDCRNKEIDGKYYVFCTSIGGTIGGLYQIDYNDNGSYAILTVNGKASQHARLGLDSMRFDGSIDIPKVLDRF
jgi:hypothetical protein